MSHANTKNPKTPHQPTAIPSKASPCGCAAHEEICCQLDCLVQPRFFCGQLLTDADLNQLLEWSRSKFRLSRFRHGWGVVCGLEVRCDSEGVRVGPGYALDCCGNDIIVCEDKVLSLDGACYCPPDPCAMPGKTAKSSEAASGGLIDFYGCEIPENELHNMVLTIRYTETPLDLQKALGHEDCGAATECQASRRREDSVLDWEDATDWRRAAVQKWRRGYDACRDVLLEFEEWYGGRSKEWYSRSLKQKWDDIRRWLLEWIDGYRGQDAHPLRQFCWVRDCLCEIQGDNFKNSSQFDQFVAKILFWLVQDCRNHFLSSECYTCPEDHGVPLARVCLHVPEQGRCKVLAIDPYPPYHRPLSLDRWPAESGTVNAAPAIWQPFDQARDLLMKLGLSVHPDQVPFEIPSDLADFTLYNDLACDLIVKRGETVALQVYDAQGCLGERVVGICGATTGDYRKERAKPAPTRKKSGA